MSARDRPVVILAGSGDLPMRLAERLAGDGREHRIIAFRGFAGRGLRSRADAVVGLLDVSSILGRLESWKAGCVTLAGGLARPGPAALLDAFSALRDRREIEALIGRGDDGLLRGALRLLEERGYQVRGVADLAPELLAEPRTYGRVEPDEAAAASIATGFALLDGISAFDVGQAAVVSGRRVLAVEGPEGTDRMLGRVRGLVRTRPFGRPRPAGAVLVKAPKLGQDLRVDLPAIGPRTVLNAARAGLAGIAVASGATVVLDAARSAAEADRLGLFLIGLDAARRAGGPS